MDAFAGFNRTPTSLHKYIYAVNNPSNGRDPSGFDEDDGVSGASGDIIADASFNAAPVVGAPRPLTVADFTAEFTGRTANKHLLLNFDIEFALQLGDNSINSDCTIDQAAGLNIQTPQGYRVDTFQADYQGIDPLWWNGYDWNQKIWTRGNWNLNAGTWYDAPGVTSATGNMFPLKEHFYAVTRVNEAASGAHEAGVTWEFDLSANSWSDYQFSGAIRQSTVAELGSW